MVANVSKAVQISPLDLRLTSACLLNCISSGKRSTFQWFYHRSDRRIKATADVFVASCWWSCSSRSESLKMRHIYYIITDSEESVVLPHICLNQAYFDIVGLVFYMTWLNLLWCKTERRCRADTHGCPASDSLNCWQPSSSFCDIWLLFCHLCVSHKQTRGEKRQTWYDEFTE